LSIFIRPYTLSPEFSGLVFFFETISDTILPFLHFSIAMAKNRRNDAYKGDHSKVSYPAKKGRPLKPNGKQVSKSQTQRIEASEKAEKLKRNAKLVAALALTSGESMDVGMARMALIVTLRLVDEAKLEIDGKSRTVKGLHQVLKRAAELTSSSYKRICDLFWSFIESAGESFDVTDNSKRGSGSDKVDRAKLYKIGEDQSAAIKLFVEYRNSAKGKGKVRYWTPHFSLSLLSPSHFFIFSP
jgi:hypothetical protein